MGPGHAWHQPLLARIDDADYGDREDPLAGVPGSPGGCYVAGAQHRYDVQDPARVARGLLPGSLDPLGAIRFRTVAPAPSAPSWVTIRAPPGPRHAPHQTRWERENNMGDFGPVGGPGGAPFDDLKDLGLDPATMRIVGLIIRSGQFIDSITPIYLDGGGQLALPKHGGDGGLETRFGLRSGEFITEISGRSGEFVDSLTIETNLGARIGLGGLGGGPVEGYELPPDTEGTQEVVALFGASGVFIDSIGIHTRQR